MPFFHVDDGFHAHKKVARLGVADFAALSLWSVAGSWCSDFLTDGFIPDYIAARMTPDYKEYAEALVRVGLWEPAELDGEAGWQFHDWSEPGRNPTSEQVKKERAATSERQRKFREKVKGTSRPPEPPEPHDSIPPEPPMDERDRNGVTNPLVTAYVAPLVTQPVPFRSAPLPSLPFRSNEETTTPRSEPAAPDSDAPPGSEKPAAKSKPKRDTTGERPDVDALCNRLVELMTKRGLRTPNITQAWRDEARRLLDKDRVNGERIPFAKALGLLEWSQSNHFWHRNIHSIPTFREKYDRLRDDANAEWEQGRGPGTSQPPGTDLALADGSNVVSFQSYASNRVPGQRVSATARAVAEAEAAGEEAKRMLAAMQAGGAPTFTQIGSGA
jgi:hypothetical protein